MHSYAHDIAELGLDNSIDERQSIISEITRVESFGFVFLFSFSNPIILLLTENDEMSVSLKMG